MKRLLLILILGLSACATLQGPRFGPQWELKAECGGGPGWAEGDRMRFSAACGGKLEIVILQGGQTWN
jgi:hypothetical protein